jgi:hypothetical protein
MLPYVGVQILWEKSSTSHGKKHLDGILARMKIEALDRNSHNQSTAYNVELQQAAAAAAAAVHYCPESLSRLGSSPSTICHLVIILLGGRG